MATNDNKGIKFSNISAFKEESDKVYIANDKAQNLSDAAKVQAQNNMMGKAYAPAQFSGLGKKVFAKNIQNVGGVQKNVMTKAFFNAANTVYVIQYDYTLGENITIPAGCTLQFDGGSISGDGTGKNTITGTQTSINAGLCKIFGTNLTLSGTWRVSEAYPEWFGAKGDGQTDDTVAIQKTIDTFSGVCLYKNYLCQTLTINGYKKSIIGISRVASIIYALNSGDLFTVGSNIREFTIKDILLTATYSENTIGVHFNETLGGAEHIINNVRIENFGYGVKAGNAFWNSCLENVRIEGCNYGLYINGSGSNIVNTFIHCYFGVSYTSNVYIYNSLNQSFINCNFGGSAEENTAKILDIRVSKQILFQNCNFESFYGNSVFYIYSTYNIVFDLCKFHDFVLSEGGYVSYITGNASFRNCIAVPRGNNWPNNGNFSYTQDSDTKISFINCETIEGHIEARLHPNSFMGHMCVLRLNNSICGPTDQRPLKSIEIGHVFFDLTLGKPIWLKEFDASNNPVWVDATGTIVS